tara:strand:+ start:1637 stop:1834 length:198 start_codon:yes stop_codon:yes gene_type:complete
MNPEEEFGYTVTLNIHDVRLLHYCVEEAIRTWPGSPARDAEEQEHLWYLRDSLYRMMLDHVFNKN